MLDDVVVLDTAAESAVAGVLLLQPNKRTLPTATRAIRPVFRMLPPSGLDRAQPMTGLSDEQESE